MAQNDNPQKKNDTGNTGKKVLPPADDKTNKDIKDEKGTGHSNQKDPSTSTYPNPFTIKINKRNPWKRQEIISATGIAISALLFFMTIQTFKNTRNQFTKSNEPYMQVNDVSLVNFGLGARFGFSYRIRNIGNFPVKMFQRGFITRVDSVEMTESIFDTDPNFTKPAPGDGPYLSDSNTDTAYIYHPTPLNSVDLMMLSAGNKHIYFAGQIVYENLITENRDTYRFIIKLQSPLYYDFIVNKNIRGK